MLSKLKIPLKLEFERMNEIWKIGTKTITNVHNFNIVVHSILTHISFGYLEGVWFSGHKLPAATLCTSSGYTGCART